MAEDTKVLEVVLELRDLMTGKLKTSANEAKKAQGVFGSLGKTVKGLVGAYLGFAAIQKFTGFLKESIKAAAEEESQIIALNAALNAYGNYTEANAKKLQDFAGALMRVTTNSDDAYYSVMRQIEALTGLSAKALPDATKAALQLSNVLKIDLDAAGRLVAKTLVGQINVLGRYGISIDMAGDSNERLTQLLNRTAAGMDMETAKMQTAEGAAKQLTIQWGEFQEAIGYTITQSPLMAESLKMITDAISAMTGEVNDNRSAWAKFVGSMILGLDAIILGFQQWGLILSGIMHMLSSLPAGMGGIGSAGTTLAMQDWEALKGTFKKWDDLVAAYKAPYSAPTGAGGAAGGASAPGGAGGSDTKTQGQTIIDAAKAALGTNFYRQVGDKKFADRVCAAAVSQILIGAGIPISPTDSSSKLRAELQALGATQVSLKDALPGDVVFRKGNAYGTGLEHSQIYAGGGKAYGEPGTSGAFQLQNVAKNSEVWRISNTALVQIEQNTQAMSDAMQRFIDSGVGLGGNAGGVRPVLDEEYARVKEYWDNASSEARQRYIDSGVGPGGNAGSEGVLFPTPGYTGEGGTDIGKMLANEFINSLAAGLGRAIGSGELQNVLNTVVQSLNNMLVNTFSQIGKDKWNGGGMGELLGSAAGGVLGGLLEWGLGALFGKKKQQQPVQEAVPVKIVNLGDLVTAFLAGTQSQRMIATAPGMQRLTTQLNLQAAQVGVV